MDTTIKLEIINCYNDFLILKDDWNRLLLNCEKDEASLKHEWHQSWWRNFGRDKKMLLLLFKKSDELVGIVPLFQQYFMYHNIIPINKISFWESGISPKIDIITPIEYKTAVIKLFIEYLISNKHLWDICYIDKIEEKSTTYNLLQDFLQLKKISYVKKKSILSPFINLNSSWDNYYKNRPKKFRKTMRNNLNRIKKFGQISIERNCDKEDLARVLPEIFSVSERSWKKLKNRSIVQSNERLFYENFTKSAGPKGWIYIWVLRHKEKAIAFEYHVVYKKKSYVLRGDFDENYGSISPGAYLEYYIIKKCFTDGIIEKYDFCGDNYQYMLNWTKDKCAHKCLILFNNNIMSLIVNFSESKLIPLYKNLFGGNKKRD